MFADVELQHHDRPRHLKALGLELQREGKKLRFPQPCSCFDAGLCRIYADRPVSCRAFECRLLQSAQRGEISAGAALKAITKVKGQVGVVRDLVRQLGQEDERVPLSKRCAMIMAQPIDLAAEDATVELRSQLMLAGYELMQTLRRDFIA